MLAKSSALPSLSWRVVATFASRCVSDVAKVPKIPLTEGGAAFEDDLRATSGVGAGDDLTSHTEKWLQVTQPPHTFSRILLWAGKRKIADAVCERS